ncbi:unnamed protein product [Prorocentrum cordatum]|uniref:Uncharacterized protein n=1 Tax=Prorocentrum cordatum TaxID=2364126 RepID=A0ABN9WS81_9DINO|nr:unnamed protein product [Polarella glacialis]
MATGAGSASGAAGPEQGPLPDRAGAAPESPPAIPSTPEVWSSAYPSVLGLLEGLAAAHDGRGRASAAAGGATREVSPRDRWMLVPGGTGEPHAHAGGAKWAASPLTAPGRANGVPQAHGLFAEPELSALPEASGPGDDLLPEAGDGADSDGEPGDASQTTPSAALLSAVQAAVAASSSSEPNNSDHVVSSAQETPQSTYNAQPPGVVDRLHVEGHAPRHPVELGSALLEGWLPSDPAAVRLPDALERLKGRVESGHAGGAQKMSKILKWTRSSMASQALVET